LSAPAWQAFYASDLQSVVAPIVLPALFLLWRALDRSPEASGLVPVHARFVRSWAVVFAGLCILDPLASGPGARALGLGERASSVLLFVLVWLGDFRVFLLAFALASSQADRRAAAGRAAAASFAVPIVAFAVERGLAALRGPLPDPALWLIYELAFCALALVLRTAWVERRAATPELRRYLRAVFGFVAGYYALWAASDMLILSGVDLGWGLRALPNQLYYGLFVPFAFLGFFSRAYASSSASTQASR
jgi:hypothetical protein